MMHLVKRNLKIHTSNIDAHFLEVTVRISLGWDGSGGVFGAKLFICSCSKARFKHKNHCSPSLKKNWSSFTDRKICDIIVYEKVLQNVLIKVALKKFIMDTLRQAVEGP